MTAAKAEHTPGKPQTVHSSEAHLNFVKSLIFIHVCKVGVWDLYSI